MEPRYLSCISALDVTQKYDIDSRNREEPKLCSRRFPMHGLYSLAFLYVQRVISERVLMALASQL